MAIKEKLEKELHRLQRDLNSHRLLSYIPGDTSDEEKSRQRERSSKLARFNEVLELLHTLEAAQPLRAVDAASALPAEQNLRSNIVPAVEFDTQPRP